MKPRNLNLFDNDGTLYDDVHAREQFSVLLQSYYTGLLGISAEAFGLEVVAAKKEFGTASSLVAMTKARGTDFEEAVSNTFLKIEFAGNVAPFVTREELESLGSPSVVFTNNPSSYARAVLGHLGLAGCFADFIGLQETGFAEKPSQAAFEAAEARHPGYDSRRFFEDNLDNLDAARTRGWDTYWRVPQGTDTSAGRGHTAFHSFSQPGLATLS